MKSFTVLALFVAVCVSTSSALRCYNCVFPGNPKCENLKDIESEQCNEPSSPESLLGVKPVCLKSVVDISGIKQITRSCSKQGPREDLNACKAFKDVSEHCSVCESDLCNGSTHMLINIWTTLVPIFIAIFMKFF